MALISKQKYDPEQIQKLYDLVNLYYDKGEPIDYEIIVDGLKVVRRTNKPDMFFVFENFVGADTKAVEILLYTGASNVNERRVFTFIDDGDTVGLSGFEVEQKMKEQLADQKKELLKEIQHEQLLKENQELKGKVSELEADVDRLGKANEELANNQSPLRPFLSEIGSSLVESFIRRNPKIIKNIPGGEALAGLIEPATQEGIDDAPMDVSFQPKERSQEDQWAILFCNQLKAQFSKDEFDKITVILQKLADDKSIIDQILNQLKP